MLHPSALRCLVALVAVAVVAMVDPSEATELSLEKFQHHVKLHERLSLWWNTNSSYIAFKVFVQTTGYVGIGLSRQSGMTDTDMLVCGADQAGGLYSCTDRYSVNKTTPVKDASQDFNVFHLSSADHARVIMFGRELTTRDDHDVNITQGNMTVVFAFGVNEEILYHYENCGTKVMPLLLPDSPETDVAPGESTTTDLLTGNFTIPSEKDTFYLCTMLKLPEFPTKHHLIRVEAVLADVSKPYVQHMILFHCTGNIEGQHNQQNQCYGASMPPAFQHCVGIMAAWAIGGEPFIYPKDIGYSLGTKDDPKYVLLQVHYDNPKFDSDIVDNSGFRLFYTDELRKYNAGILEVGMDPSPYHVIPPHMSAFVSHGLCSTDPLRDGPISRLHVFASLLHAHMAGRKIRVRQFRDGKEIGSLGKDDTYDVNGHKNIYLAQEVEVVAGDKLVVECTYKTKERSNITTGGFGRRQEMCLAYLHYYPRGALARCRSTPHVPTLARDLLGCEVNNSGKNRYVVTAPREHERRPLESVMAEYTWSAERVEAYTRILRYVDYDMKYYLSDIDKWLYKTARLPGVNIVSHADHPDPWRCCWWKISIVAAFAILLL